MQYYCWEDDKIFSIEKTDFIICNLYEFTGEHNNNVKHSLVLSLSVTGFFSIYRVRVSHNIYVGQRNNEASARHKCHGQAFIVCEGKNGKKVKTTQNISRYQFKVEPLGHL